jgi:hypothetical protein
MLYRYVNVGALGPIPNMYEPTWVSPSKLASAWAEGAAVIVTAAGLTIAISTHSAKHDIHGGPGRVQSGCAGSALASWLRELMPSVVNTFRRW